MTVLSVCSEGLWRRLTDERVMFSQAVEELAADPAAVAELGCALERLETLAAPCGPRAVLAHLTPLVSLYGVAEKSEGEWKAFWGFYHRALGDMPENAVREGVEDYVRAKDSEFFPKPGPLRELCVKRSVHVRMALGRAKAVLSSRVAR